jgi:large subunit ribosomal protein L23
MNILIKPIVTEKMERLSDKLNQYGFLVEKSANKLQIKSAIEELYGVTVDSINTIRHEGKLKTRYTRSGYLVGRTNACKKAIVTLKKGEKIDFYSNI